MFPDVERTIKSHVRKRNQWNPGGERFVQFVANTIGDRRDVFKLDDFPMLRDLSEPGEAGIAEGALGFRPRVTARVMSARRFSANSSSTRSFAATNASNRPVSRSR